MERRSARVPLEGEGEGGKKRAADGSVAWKRVRAFVLDKIVGETYRRSVWREIAV